MSITTSSAATSDPNWATTTTQPATQQWQSQEQYQQYYNYYQAMSQAAGVTTAVTSTASDSTTAYTQDYSKAWDEYYKAYYGQSYSVSAAANPYPTTSYSYDQYGYPNLAAPPPTYQYESVTTPATYQYPQSAPVATAYGYTDTQSSTQTAAAWKEPQPSYEKPNSYYPKQSYEHPPVSYEKVNNYGNGSNNNNSQKDSYLERFPPPPFDSGNKQEFGNRGGNYRGRSSNTDNRSNNFRRPMRGHNNTASSQPGNFNDSQHYDEDVQNQNNDDYYGYNNSYQNDSFTNRGRGSRPSYRGRGNTSFRGRGGGEGYESNNKRFSTGEFKQGYNNKSSQNYNAQNWNSGDNFNQNNAWDNNYETNEESSWPSEDNSYSTRWNHQTKRPMMDFNNQDHIRPMPLMDIEVCPTEQSSIVIKRQALINKWQSALQTIAEQNLPIQHHWSTIKTALSSDVQQLLLPTFVKGNNVVYCELHLSDIFLVQAKGFSEDDAIEEAAKILWKMFQNKLFIRTTTRGCATDKVPVFCISESASGPVSVPPIANGTTMSRNVAVLESVINFDKVCKQEQPIHGGKNQWAFDEPEDDITENNQNAVCTEKQLPETPSTLPEATSKLPEAQLQVPNSHNFADDDIFLVVNASPNEKDQSISILNNTAKFNNITIEYKHEKPENATHISQCLITINGQQFEKSEAREYLVAKREAADKAVSVFKLSCPQIIFNVDRATELVKADIVQSGKSTEEASCDWLKQFAIGDSDSIYRLSQSFTNTERDTIGKMAVNLNLTTKPEGNNVLLIFKQFPLVEMKKRLLKLGYCAQYQLVGFESNDQKSV